MSDNPIAKLIFKLFDISSVGDAVMGNVVVGNAVVGNVMVVEGVGKEVEVPHTPLLHFKEPSHPSSLLQVSSFNRHGHVESQLVLKLRIES